MMTTFGNKSSKKADDKEVIQNTDFGSVLADARKAKNKTIEEVSEFLKIPGQLITAIEQNNITELPAPTFTQGYIRSYARYLNTPEDEVLDMYNLAVPHQQAAKLKLRSKLPDEMSSQSPLVKLVTTLLILAGIAAIVYGSYNYYQEKAGVMESQLESKQQSFTGNSLNSPASLSGTQRLMIKQNAYLTEDDELVVGKTADASLPESEVEQESTSQPSTVDSKNDESAEVSKNDAAKTKAAKTEDTIEIYAEQGAWLEVYDAQEQRLFYNMLSEGRTKVLTGQSPFRLALGNARSTRISVNGTELDIKKFIRLNNTASFKVSTEDDQVSLY